MLLNRVLTRLSINIPKESGQKKTEFSASRSESTKTEYTIQYAKNISKKPTLFSRVLQTKTEYTAVQVGSLRLERRSDRAGPLWVEVGVSAPYASPTSPRACTFFVFSFSLSLP